MVSPPSLVAPAAAALAVAAAALGPGGAAAANPRASSLSVLRPGSAPMMKGSESKPKRRSAAGGLDKGWSGTGRRAQGGGGYCDAAHAPKFAVNDNFGTGDCLTFPENKRLYKYSSDFEEYGPVLNKMKHYVCPASGVRVIESNSIPDHDINQGNFNFPCETLGYFELPLNPTKAATKSEVPPQGHIGVATNGVHLFGAQEAAGGNAIDKDGQFKDARFWYGHATRGNRSHYHSPNAGHDPDLEGGPAGEDELLGWALDGYPIYGFTNETLDECNGRTGEDGEYRYHVRYPAGWDAENCWDSDVPAEYCSDTQGANNWNYILGCYWGDVTTTKIGDLTSYQRPNDCVPTPVSGKRPNFIVMQPDDLPFFQNWNPPAHFEGGTDGAVAFPSSGMPNLDRMIAGGLTMGQAYAASSMCGTSRYSTITGRYASRSSYGRHKNDGEDLREVVIPATKLEDVNSVLDGMDCGENNVAQRFKAGGYRTGVVGKWHLHSRIAGGYNYTQAQASIRDCGFDYAEAIYPENMGGAWSSPENNDGMNITHNMEHVVARGIEFIGAAGDPFFLYFNPTVPHSSADVSWALEHGNCLESVEGLLQSEPFIPNGMTNGGALTCREYRNNVTLRAGQRASDKELGSIWVDDAVGAIYEYLQETDQLDNTFFLFQQDHGQEGKGTVYEQGLRIFQLVHYPDAAFNGGDTFNGLVSTVDIAPTMLDYAGIDPSYGMDGESWKTAAENRGEATGLPDFEDRCLVFELQKDRAVRCGCDKMLYIGGNSNSTTKERGLSRGFSFQTNNDGNILNTFFDLCDGGSGPSVASPEDNPEANGTTYTPGYAAAQRLTSELSCHIAKTAPSSAVAPDYSGCGVDPVDPPCVDLESFPQKAGRLNGTMRDCDWVIEGKDRCDRYMDECRKSCTNCTTSAPTSSPTSNPTSSSTSSQPGPWDVLFLGLSNDFSASSDKEVSADYLIGKDRKYEAVLFANDCQTNITDITINTTTVIMNENATHDKLTVHQSVDKSSIGNSTIWNDTSNKIEVCQVVRLVLPVEESGGNGKMHISSDIRQISIVFDLSAEFNITAGLEAGTVFNETSTTDVSSFVNAYKCKSSNNFDADDSALSPNQELFVCVVSISDEVNVHQLVSMTVTQQGTAETNLDVIEGGRASIDSLTSIQYVNSENGVVVGTRLPVNTFNFAAGVSVSIQGEIQMKLANGGTSRKLRALQGAGIEGDEKASYALEVDLVEGDAAVADGVVPAAGNSAISIAAMALSKALACATAIAFVLVA